MIWADRFAIGFFVLGFLGLMLILGPDFTIQFGLTLAGILGVGSWIVFRTIDFMFGGPMYRRREKSR